MAYAGRAVLEAAGATIHARCAPARGAFLGSAVPGRDADDARLARQTAATGSTLSAPTAARPEGRSRGARVTIDLDGRRDRRPHARGGRARRRGRVEARVARGRGRVLRRGGLPTAEDVAAYYRERKMAAVVFTVDAETVTGRPAAPNEEIAAVAAANADVLIPFASVDPNTGREPSRRRAADPRPRRPRLQVPPEHPGVLSERPPRLPAVRGDPGGGLRRSSTRATAGSARAFPAAAASASSTRTRSTSTTWRPTSRS